MQSGKLLKIIFNFPLSTFHLNKERSKDESFKQNGQ